MLLPKLYYISLILFQLTHTPPSNYHAEEPLDKASLFPHSNSLFFYAGAFLHLKEFLYILI
jgi:hypothetical protein